MDIKLQIKILCATCQITQKDLARRLHMSPQNLNSKMSRGSFSIKDLEEIAEAVGAKYVGHFLLPDGKEI